MQQAPPPRGASSTGARHPTSGPTLGALPQHGHSERSTAQPPARLTTGQGHKPDQHHPAPGLHRTTRLGLVGANTLTNRAPDPAATHSLETRPACVGFSCDVSGPGGTPALLAC